MRFFGLFAVMLAVGSVRVSADELRLPPEVTPKLRAACETDVRRLCIDTAPTYDKVKTCVASKFFQLGRKCQVELASLGYGQ